MNIIQWLSSIGFNMPGLAWLNYIIGAVLLLVIIDAFLSLIFSGIHTLFTGGRR